MRPKSLLSLLLLAAPLGLGCKSSMSNTDLKGIDVEILPNASTKAALAFSPANFAESFATRAKVVWINGDEVNSGGAYGGMTGTTHHLVSDTPGLFDSGLFQAGSRFNFTFAAPGVYTYHCSIHPTMVGTITIDP